MRHFSHIFLALGRTFNGRLSCGGPVGHDGNPSSGLSEDPTTVADSLRRQRF